MTKTEIDVGLIQKSTYDIITIRIDNYRSLLVAIRLSIPLPASVSQSDLMTMSEERGDSWTITEESMQFIDSIDWGSSIETAYASEALDYDVLDGMMQEATLEVRDHEGNELEIIEGEDIQIDSEPTTDLATDQTDLDLTNSAGRTASEITHEQEGDSQSGETATEERSISHGIGQEPSSSTDKSNERNTGDAVQPTSDKSTDVSNRRLPKSDTKSTMDTEDDSKYEREPHRSRGNTADSNSKLPASVSSYVLSDISDEITAEDFSWRTMKTSNEQSQSESESSSGWLSWVKSLF